MSRHRSKRPAMLAMAVTLGVLVAQVVGAGVAVATDTRQAPGRARLAAPPEGVVPDLAALGWVQVFHDDFRGAAVDESVWDVVEEWNSTRDAVRVEPDPGEPGDGVATITAYSVDTNGSQAGGLQHFSGALHTGDISNRSWSGMHATYGYIEARVRLHNPPGTRSNFYLLSPTWHRAPWGDPAASGPEIDLFEIANPAAGDVRNDDTGAPGADGICDYQKVRLPCDRIAGGTLHWNGFEEDHAAVGQQVPWSGASPQDNFVTYSLLWTPDGYWMYRDGVQTFHSTEAITYNPEWMVIDQCVYCSGTAPAEGFGNLATSPNKMMIDYVRIWQRPVSDIPNRTVAANTALAIPFSVTDYFSASASGTVGVAGKPRPEAVQVSVTGSTNTALLPNNRIALSGNEPSDVDGSLANAGFESGPAGWNPSGAASTWGTRVHSGASSARLTQAGGRIEQTITGLRPQTTYQIGAFFNQELGFTDTHTKNPDGSVTTGPDGRLTWIADTNGDGRVDQNELEPITEPGDLGGDFDIGIVDTDASRAGSQDLVRNRGRNGYQEAAHWWGPRTTDWEEETLTFTTGPATTQVTFFVDNTITAGEAANEDTDLSVDDVWVRALDPPNRTVTLRPTDNATGSTTVTLAAWVDSNHDGIRAGSETLGTDSFTVTFTNGSSFTNGDFETGPVGTGWELWDNAPGAGAEVIVDNPFQLDRVLELAGPGWQPDTSKRSAGTVFQRVSGLQPNTAYTLSVTGKGADLRFGFQGFVGTDPCATATACAITNPDAWVRKSITFTADGTGTGNVVILDWNPADGVSLVDDVTLTTAAATSLPPVVSPQLTALGEQRLASSAPVALGFSLPNTSNSTTITSLASNNQALLPDTNLAVTKGSLHKVLGLSPVPDRTGKAVVTIGWNLSGVAQPPKQISVFVSDGRLENPGFENPQGWSGPTIVTSGQRSGKGALRLDGAAVVRQQLTGLPDNTEYALTGWVNGSITVTIRTVPDASRQPPESFAEVITGTWSGSGWTAGQTRFITTQCPDCEARGGHIGQKASAPKFAAMGGQVEISLSDTNPSGPSLVDDLALIRVPTSSPIRELSLRQNQSAFSWDTKALFDVGRLAAGAASSGGSTNPTVVGFTTTDVVPAPPGLGEVLPDANVRVIRDSPYRESEWALDTHTTGATQRTGRSNVTVTLTDPATGLSTQRSVMVTVNAGSINNGTFGRDDGWGKWTFGETSWQIVQKQRWRYLNCTAPATQACPNWTRRNLGYADADRVLRVSSGIVGYKVTGLTPGVRYVIQANALGDGSALKAVAGNGAWGSTPVPRWGTVLGEVPIAAQEWAPTTNLFFTPIADDPGTSTLNESDVWIFVWDAQDPDVAPNPPPVPASDRACALYAAGETCIDDIGVFRASDLGL